MFVSICGNLRHLWINFANVETYTDHRNDSTFVRHPRLRGDDGKFQIILVIRIISSSE